MCSICCSSPYFFVTSSAYTQICIYKKILVWQENVQTKKKIMVIGTFKQLSTKEQ